MSDLRVLVVDDDEAILRLIQKFFSHRGDVCTVHTNGHDALHAMQDRLFDVMLSDIQMPVMGGLELVQRAKLLQPNLACILISGYGTRLDIIGALKVGVFDFVEKPIADLAEFTMIVERAAASSRLAQDRDALLENLREQNTRLEFSLLRLHEAFGQLRRQEESMESDLRKAQRVQRKFLPAGLPGSPELDLFAYFGPCEFLGGDFFGTIPLPDGRFALYLVDVAGHGVSAALVTVTIREWMRSPPRLSGNGDFLSAPHQVLSFMDESLRAEAFDPPIFVTMLYAIFDPSTGRVELASAGHPAPLLVRGQERHRIAGRGPVLGGSLPGRFETTSLTLERGDVMLLYSDGLPEAVSTAGEELTVSGLHEVLAENRGATAAEIGAALETATTRHLGGQPATDDMSFIVVRRPLTVPVAPTAPGEQRGMVKIVIPRTLRFLPPTGPGRLVGGWNNRTCIIRLRGRVTWQLASTLRDMMKRAFSSEADRIAIDLAECEGLDSTMLGVLLQHAATVIVQQPGPHIVEQLRDMGILDQLTIGHDPLPPIERPILIEATESQEVCSELILSAHEALMEASVSNRQRFGDVVAALRPSEDSDQ